MKIVAISDTHGYHRELDVPDGDVLVHAGDFSANSKSSIEDFNDWLGEFPHKHKIVIAGNHDFCFQDYPKESRNALTNAIYLQDSGVKIERVKFWGSPWQPWFHDWAFNLSRGPEISAKWRLIPMDTDVLITHGPPHGILDTTDAGRNAGCEDLFKAVMEKRPRVHLFGHIHEGHGESELAGVLFYNVSICNQRYNPVNKPLVVCV